MPSNLQGSVECQFGTQRGCLLRLNLHQQDNTAWASASNKNKTVYASALLKEPFIIIASGHIYNHHNHKIRNQTLNVEDPSLAMEDNTQILR